MVRFGEVPSVDKMYDDTHPRAQRQGDNSADIGLDVTPIHKTTTKKIWAGILVITEFRLTIGSKNGNP